jgi:hypothetical protein
MTNPVVVASYRTHLEAEVAARILEAADIPCVINSAEGMLYGPLGVGATILVRPDDAEAAREVLLGSGGSPEGCAAALIAVLPESPDSGVRVDRVREQGVPVLVRAESGRLAVWVRREHADRAARLLGVGGRRRWAT